jgi:hypothetical protein
MLKKAFGSSISFTLSCTYALSLIACSQISPGSTQGVGNGDRLTSAHWTAYVTNSQYLQALTKPGVSVQLNLADPRQFDFVMARLQLAGKTMANSPHLFDRVAARRQDHIARGLKAGAFAAGPQSVTSGRVAMHFIEEARVSPVQRAALTGARRTAASASGTPLATGTASSTFPGGSDYTYVDVSVSTISGTAVAPLAYQEEFDNPNGNIGANVTISTSGDPSVSNQTRYAVESYKFEDYPDGTSTDSYVHEEIGSASPKAPVGLPQLSIPQVNDPRDTVGLNSATPDGIISVCMDRNWTNDCDYILNTGSVVDHRIKMPLKGAVTLTTQHVFDHAQIDAEKAALAANMTPPFEPGQVKLVLTNVGGGCDVDANNALIPGMSGFWNFATLSPDNKTLSWDATGANALKFDEGCTQIQNLAKLTMRIPAPVLSVPGNVPFTVSFTITDDPATLRPDATLPPITLTNSCLAEGTQIEIAAGKLAPIESLQIGQVVFNPYATGDHALTIKDTAQGHERVPMVRIRDQAGRTLLMTEMHPIATADRGMVQARALKTGDVVMTTQGPSKLIEVSREAYSGKVYNLKVGSEAQMASLGPDQTVVHANGFVVGDGQIQSKYEELSMKHGARTIDQVPEVWRLDYLLSAARR